MIIQFITLITKSTLLATIFINLFISISFLIFSRHKYNRQNTDKLTLALNDRIANLKNSFSAKFAGAENSSQYFSRDNLGVTNLSSWLHNNWDSFDDQQRKNYSVAFVKNADKMINFMNNILDFATLNKENFYLKIQSINLTSLILERTQECSKLYQNQQINFHYDLEPEIFVKGDIYLIKQAIDNLLIKALDRNHNHIYIKLAATQILPLNAADAEQKSKQHRAVEFIIRDQNKPFNKVSLSSSQKNTTALKFNSTKDINLALCKKIIEVHDGFIEAISIKNNSEAGFKFLLPTQ